MDGLSNYMNADIFGHVVEFRVILGLTVITSFTPVHIASISSFTTSSSHNSSGLHCVLVSTRWSVLY